MSTEAFIPKPTRTEARAARTDAAAREIVSEESEAQQAKTERLRQARAAREKAEGKEPTKLAKKPVRKTRRINY